MQFIGPIKSVLGKRRHYILSAFHSSDFFGHFAGHNMRYAVITFAVENIGGRPAMYSREEEPIAELLDFGVMYALYRRLGQRLILKASWETAAGAVCSATFELDLKHSRLIALGRKGNALAPETFCAERLCAWARSELATTPD